MYLSKNGGPVWHVIQALVLASWTVGCTGELDAGRSGEPGSSAEFGLSIGSMNVGREYPTATALANGKILVAGGATQVSLIPYQLATTPTAELYDSVSGTFALTGSLLQGRARHTATLLSNGKVLVVGGTALVSNSYVSQSSAELYDSSTGTWSSAGHTSMARLYHTATLLADGRVLVTGGFDSGNGSTSSCEFYNPSTNTWSPAPALLTGRRAHSAVLLGNGKVLVSGGLASLGMAYFSELFDPVTNAWSASANYPTPRSSHRSFALPDGRAIIVGGYDSSSIATNSVQIYQPASNSWGTIGSLTDSRADFQGVSLPDGSVLVAGGKGLPSAPLTSVELFTPTSLVWAVQTSLSKGRAKFGMAPAGAGQVLLAGGGTTENSAELHATTCTPTTCAVQGRVCGTFADGCGGYLSCGSCASGQTCTTTGSCCQATTCAAQGATCGVISNNCGGTLTCGACAFGQLCQASSCVTDSTPPSTAITSPKAGTTLSGLVTLTASASDSFGVSRVEFYDAANFLGTSYASPYGLSWNTAAGANGSHRLTTRAYDLVGNVGISPSIDVSVSNTSSTDAAYDATYRAPKCGASTAACSSGSLLNGRGALGPEANAPNTLGGTCTDGTSGVYHSDESLDRLKVSTVDGSVIAAGKTVRIDATVWAWSGYTNDQLDLYYTNSPSAPVWTYLTTLTPSGAGLQTLTSTYVLPAGTVQAVRGTFRYGGSAGACTTGAYDDHDDLVFVTQ